MIIKVRKHKNIWIAIKSAFTNVKQILLCLNMPIVQKMYYPQNAHITICGDVFP